MTQLYCANLWLSFGDLNTSIFIFFHTDSFSIRGFIRIAAFFIVRLQTILSDVVFSVLPKLLSHFFSLLQVIISEILEIKTLKKKAQM